MSIQKLFCLIFCFMLIPLVVIATEDSQEVTITIIDETGNVVVGEPTPPPTTPTPMPTVNVEEPIYEADGSIQLTMTFAGDTTIGENVQSSGRSIFEKEFEKNDEDVNFPFKNTSHIFFEDDYTMLNFEGTLTTQGINPSKRDNDFLFRADPSFVKMFMDNSVEVVSLENNHVLDMGEKGFEETKKVFTEAGIPYASTNEPAIVVRKGITIGLLAYQTFGGLHDKIAKVIPEAIANLREQGCQVVVVSYHWGAELDYAPNNNQVKLGRATIDAGADLVVGHHSHRINPIEFYKGKYIVYSLSNFSFAGNSKPADMATYIFQLRLRIKDNEILNQEIKIIPCRISSKSDYNDLIPTPYTEQANIEAVINVLKQNGKKLEYAIDTYPLSFLDDEE